MNRVATIRTVAAGAALLALAVGARSAQAQGSVSFTPYGGIYVPTQNSFSTVGADIKRNNSFVGGARLTLWGKSPLGLEFSAGYAPASVDFAGTIINESRDTKVFVGNLRLMLGVSPATSGFGLYVGAGPAVVRQGNDVTDPNASTTDFAGNIGAGLRLPIGGSAAIRFDAEDYLYNGNFDGSNDFQNDLVLSAGLSIGL
jgi:Outer membrane protein beta-barrel domain